VGIGYWEPLGERTISKDTREGDAKKKPQGSWSTSKDLKQTSLKGGKEHEKEEKSLCTETDKNKGRGDAISKGEW